MEEKVKTVKEFAFMKKIEFSNREVVLLHYSYSIIIIIMNMGNLLDFDI